ncbi:MAG TPA: hypothetical protein VIV11_18880, partial [Kofleriaceae bacterium]
LVVKLPAAARGFTRRAIGVGAAQPIAPAALAELASREPVIVIGVGMVGAGALDPRLPGEHRVASLVSLADAVADLPKQRAIVLHCG